MKKQLLLQERCKRIVSGKCLPVIILILFWASGVSMAAKNDVAHYEEPEVLNSYLDLPTCTTYISICAGESYTPPGGTPQTTTGVYCSIVPCSGGLDSIIVTNLTVNPTYNITVDTAICDDETLCLPWGGIAVPGNNCHLYSSIGNCDSLVTIHLTVNPTYDITLCETICDCQTFTLPWGGLGVKGCNSHHYSTIENCDSLVTINLIINSTYNIHCAPVSACDSYTLPWGPTVTLSGNYYHHYTSIGNCDSLVTIHVNIHHSSSTVCTFVNACESYTLPWGPTVTATGSYCHHYTSIGYCDSLVTIHVTIYQDYQTTGTPVTVCDHYILPWGDTATSTGNYCHTYTSVTNCDSIVTIHVTINGGYQIVCTPVTACDSFALPWGPIVTSSGSYCHLYSTIGSCDSLVTIHVTINHSYNIVCGRITACHCYTLPWGTMVTTSGNYCHLYTSVGNCDSLVTLQVTINPTYNTIGDSVTACESYTLPWEPEEIAITTNNYSHHYNSIYGCDSLVTIHVTIHYNSNPTSYEVTSCDSFNLPWDGTVTASGNYTHVYTNISGCDSSVTADVTIHHSSTPTGFSVTRCNSYCLPWGVTVTASGDYPYTYTNCSGCDSLVTAHVTINYNSNTSEYSVTSCDSYTLPWGGVVTSSDNYAHAYTNIGGCDSVVIAHVTINLSYSLTAYAQICEGDFYSLPWGDSAIATGDYTHHYNTSAGCDSSITIHVLVNPAPDISLVIDTALDCSTGLTQLTSSSSTPGATFNWIATNGGHILSGDNTATPIVDEAGTYTLTVTDTSTWCTASGVVIVTPCQEITTCFIYGDTVICQGQSTTLCAPAGFASYLWSTGSTCQSITVNCSGTFCVTVTTAAGGSVTCCLQVTVVPRPCCNITGNTHICQGQSTTLCAPPGYASYYWNTGATTQSITVSSAGTYCVTVTNSNGCTSTCSVCVIVRPQPGCSISGSSSICDGQTVCLCAPVGALNYLWSTGATTRCINITTGGTYTVTVTNCNGCSNTCSKTVIQTQSTPCTISGGGIFLCQGGQPANLCAPVGYASYQWSTGESTRCITVNSAGPYSVTVTNISGCTSTCSTFIAAGQPPPCNITGCGSICLGETGELCAPPGYASYQWNTGDTTQCITVDSAGTYCVTVTNYDGCTSTCSKTITVSQPPSCYITGCADTICSGQSVYICAPAGYNSYLWSTGECTRCILVTGAGTYTVTVTNSSGCTSSCSKTITVNELPECEITGCEQAICQGQPGTLCAPAGYASYEWSTGASTQCIDITTAGTYTVTVTNSSGCTTVCSRTVSSSQAPPCHITGCDNFCQGQTAELCAPPGYASYEWSTGDTTQCIEITTGGTYTVTVTNSSGCTSTCCKTVTVNPPLPCEITGCGQALCQGEAVDICAPAGYAYYLWSTGATTQCINVDSAGTYTVTVTSSSGCISTCSKTITVNQGPSCSIAGGGIFICQGGQPANLCAPVGYASYQWNTGDTTRCITVTASGTYTVTVTNSSGCTSSCSTTLSSGLPILCNITGCGSICQGQTGELCAPPGYASYLWNTGDTTECITIDSAGTYCVTVTSADGCTSTCSKTVNVSQPPSCIITGCGNSLCDGQEAVICAPGGYASYLWSTGDTTQCITIDSAGTYTVTVTNNDGCTSSCSKTITINEQPVCTIAGGGIFLCDGQPGNLCAPAGYASYAWSTGESTQCIDITSAGTYTVTVTNSNGCTSSCSQSVTSNTPPFCDITGQGSLCQNDSIELCAPAGLAGYLWNTGDTTQCITVSSAGTYTVTVTNSLGCTSTCCKTVTADVPCCNISGNSNICEGQSTCLCAPSGFASYLWSTGQTTRCITVDSAGTYCVTVTNSDGCSGTCSKTVTVSPPPNSTICGNTNICRGQSTSLCAPPGGASYHWSTGATTRCISVRRAGTYSVTVTNCGGCSRTSSVCVVVSPRPRSTICGNTRICPGQSTTLCAPTGAFTYYWSTDETTRCITINCPGTYSVTVTNAAGCSSTSYVCVTLRNPPSCHISGNTSICPGQSTCLCAPAGCASYQWSTGATTRCIIVSCAGTYQVTVTNAAGCSSTCSVCVNVSSHGQCGNGDDKQAVPGNDGNNTLESVAYPNPFNSTTTIQFRNTGEKARAVVDIYGLDGGKISELYNSDAESNELYKVDWNAEALPNGLYLYRIVCGDKVVTGRLILDK